MTRPPRIRNQTSSGGVIFRKRNGKTEVALVLVRGGKAWCLPKGLVDRDEDVTETAVREVREETGLAGDIRDKVGQISYWYYVKNEMVRVHKTVHFFLLEYSGGNTGDHDHEVDEARWFPIDTAVDQLTYKSEKKIMEKARGMIQSGSK